MREDYDGNNWGDGSETYAYTTLKAIEKDYDNYLWVSKEKDCWELWNLDGIELDETEDWNQLLQEWEEYGDCPSVYVEKVKVRTGKK